MIRWQDSDKIVLVYYTGYAGGKFIINSLSLNDSCCPAIFIDDAKSVEENLATKVPCIMATIPPSKEACLNWTAYELHCDSFWKYTAYEYDEDPTVIDRMPEVSKQILEDHYCFKAIHHDGIFAKWRKEFPNARVLQIYNYVKFIHTAAPLKGCTDTQATDNPDVVGDFLFDMDNTIFSWETFEQELIRCLKWLGLEYTPTPEQRQLYEQYIALHR